MQSARAESHTICRWTMQIHPVVHSDRHDVLKTDTTTARERTRRAMHLIRRCRPRVRSPNTTTACPFYKAKPTKKLLLVRSSCRTCTRDYFSAARFRGVNTLFSLSQNKSRMSEARSNRRRGADPPSNHPHREWAWSLPTRRMRSEERGNPPSGQPSSGLSSLQRDRLGATISNPWAFPGTNRRASSFS